MICEELPRIISRREAKAAGLKKYYTGKACPKGHVCERLISGACVECHREYTREFLERNPEYSRKYYAKNKERYTGKATRHSSRISAAKKFGYVPAPHEDGCPPYPSDNRCQHCNKDYSDKRLCLDHDHETGNWRGWICYQCNSVYGQIDKVGIERVIAHLLLGKPDIDLSHVMRTSLVLVEYLKRDFKHKDATIPAWKREYDSQQLRLVQDTSTNALTFQPPSGAVF